MTPKKPGYMVIKEHRINLAVERNIHQLVKMYAVDRKISVIEATYDLFRIAFTSIGWMK